MYRQDRLRALRFLDSVIAAPGKPSFLYSYTNTTTIYIGIYILHYLYYLYAYIEGSRDYLFVERSLKEVTYILCLIYDMYIYCVLVL